MNSFNKTEAAVFLCRLCLLRAFPFTSLIFLQLFYTNGRKENKYCVFYCDRSLSVVRCASSVNFLYLNIFSSETAHLIFTKLHKNDPWVVPYQSCSNCSSCRLTSDLLWKSRAKAGLNIFRVKVGILLLKSRDSRAIFLRFYWQMR